MYTMISERLKQATHHAHQSLEAMLIPAMKQIRHSSEYAQLLHLFYGYYYPLEIILTPFASAYLPDFEQRRKSALLLRDLEAMGESTDSIPLATKLPAINNISQALGAMYVLEGSTLGGTHIAKMLSQQLELTSNEALLFFQGYGPVTGSMWKTFIQALNDYPATEAEEALLVQAANDTFDLLKQWTALHYGASYAKEKL